MKTKIEIKSVSGQLLFDFEKEGNTIKDTLQEAVKSDANLQGANLRRANLYGAFLFGVNLYDANLFGANLQDTNLFGANLQGVNLRGAYLGDWGELKDTSDILITGQIGSRNGYTAIFNTDKGIFVQCGCYKGSLDEFVSKVKETHQGNKHERDYLALVEFAKIKFQQL